jgi:hypothetical protein
MEPRELALRLLVAFENRGGYVHHVGTPDEPDPTTVIIDDTFDLVAIAEDVLAANDSPHGTESVAEVPYPTRPVECACGLTFTMWWNGGELDRHRCACGRVYEGEHRQTVMVVRQPQKSDGDA